MWAIDNETCYAADRCFVRDVDGAEIWVVAVRATYVWNPDGSVTLASEQQPVCLAPKYWGEPAKSSLRYDSDMVRTKKGTDVIVHAHAHAPGGTPAPTADVGFSVGRISKQLRVHGNRHWVDSPTGLVPSRPVPFLTQAIRYETAMGGPLRLDEPTTSDTSNRVGIGRVPRPGLPAPSVELINQPITSPSHKAPPAGFGPIPCDWEPRIRLAGTYNTAWQQTRQPLVPADFNDAHFHCAPTDQQAGTFLQGGEEVLLRNLTPEGLTRFRLPRVALGFRTRIDGGVTHHRAQLHTVIVEPQDCRLVMVWHTSLACHHTLYTLKETVVFEKERVPLGRESDPSHPESFNS